MSKNILHRLSSENSLTQLNYIYSLLILAAMAFILTTAMYMQLVYSEYPCPLCLLQRVAYFGVCFGVILNLRNGYSMRYEGLTLLSTILLLIISSRQTLLDIYPRPGHEYIGSAFLGLHMPVWSIVFSILLLLAYAIRFCILGFGDYLTKSSLKSYPKTALLAGMLMWLVIVLCGLNVLSTFFQCGFSACHTFVKV
ncbi:disulfide bond formation protein B [Legionella massiliensis]|uniref:Disulfide bond formation protein B n=1 Tax=Legionella massiliensis TaxID=1034943 RepID=A0A078L4E1_9GAMM|nr:disulfide bond formation protein B [Legionella massiliensis]CDZ78944.1 disulfide bond formation protein B [Legionella massiliensis]CEE14682.1 Disulfide bond formation protein B [Legionella massiliensis]